ncbi:hypothetical protein CYMTET_11915 [Cymbomonas tetramitiformis]|uniref:Patatin n=1 Tax=Cymbomonas tetramitiformis TaxID=36881 RepID=A0AAE0GL59_9CHLO|nr:hypothetical protein CYMTET_11915 [Cymbomonas tetramitiformis]
MVPRSAGGVEFEQAAKSLGSSALCLSGGGAIAMYHQGVILALLECGLYKDISVVSGTSGGSIMAAMCAMKTEQELRDEVIAPDVSTNYKRDGSMKREGISWFPPLMEQVARYLREGVLVDQKAFMRCCRFYYGDTTFGEAFAITGKHVSITVSASRSSSGPQRLLLNHISTPHVLLSSAVTASCSLPGIMKANILEAKDAEGNIVPFEVDGVEWIDGSVQADVPFRRMATVFSVSNFIVSQVNPHVVPFIHMQEKGNGDVRVSQNSFYWRLCRVLDMDMRSRVLALSNLGLMPRLFGQDMTRIFTQKYHGHITIVPKLILSESIGMRAIMNPSLKDMIRYISGGQRSTWPHIARIQHTIHLERILDRCITELKEQHFSLSRSYSSSNILDNMAQNESATGTKNKVSMGFQWEWEIQKLRAHISRLEEENDSLRTVVKELAFVVGPRPRSQPSPHNTSPPRVDVGGRRSSEEYAPEDEPPDEDPTRMPTHARRRSTGNLLGSPGSLIGAIPSRTPKKSNGISRSMSLKYINESSVMDEMEHCPN